MASIPRCQIVPLPHDRVAFTIDGEERTTWHFGSDAPRPFFFPIVGPRQTWVTRMGHPGAPNHDHHRSVWFAHHKVLGIDFWSDTTDARIRQNQWLAYEDGDDEAIMAVECSWYDGHDPQPLLKQRLFAAVIPGDEATWSLELQVTLAPSAAMIELQKTNFGLLAIRVAKGISAAFGNGKLTDSEGRVGERAVFGKRARWVDYSGSARARVDGEVHDVGITCIDHPSNPGHPTHWHVRDDGWMGASLCFDASRTIAAAQPLVLRYLLWIHDGSVSAPAVETEFDRFGRRPGFEIKKRPKPHHHYGVQRKANDG